MYLSPPAQAVLQGWLASRPVSNDRAVFISEHGKRLSVAGIQYLLRDYCTKAGIKLTSHHLRHAFGRHMAEANMPLTSLQSLLGHKDIRTTQIYVHLSNSHLHDEYDLAMSQLLPVPSSVHSTQKIKHQSIPKAKRVNWRGYLDSLPEWLTKLIRSLCSKRSQVKDSVQQTRNVLSQVSRFFRWMLEVRPLKTGEIFPHAITETQLNELLKMANPFDYAWILLMAHSGLRTCEIRNLRWQDIDLQRRTVRIESSKDLRSRIVFLSVPALDALKQLPKISEQVFTYNNRLLSDRYCQSRLKTLSKQCGMQVTPHQLRHTCATMLLNAGMSIFGVQEILGHKYVDTTLRYAKTYDSTAAKDYQKAIETLGQNATWLLRKGSCRA